MATTFHTQDSKLAYDCRKAQRSGDHVALTIVERNRSKDVAGRIVDVSIEPNGAGDLIWQITLA
jgi:hypothetical protein